MKKNVLFVGAGLLGRSLMRLNPAGGWVVVVAQSLVLFVFSSAWLQDVLRSAGLPVLPLIPGSSSQAVVGAVCGVAVAHGWKGVRQIQWTVLRNIAIGWVLTPVIAAGACYVTLFVVQNVFEQEVYRQVVEVAALRPIAPEGSTGSLGYQPAPAGLVRLAQSLHRDPRRQWLDTMAMPCSLAAFMTSSSLIDPPGWIIAVTPWLAAASTLSLNGQKASEAMTEPLTESPASEAFCAAILVESILYIWPAPTPTVRVSAANLMALLFTCLHTLQAKRRSASSFSFGPLSVTVLRSDALSRSRVWTRRPPETLFMAGRSARSTELLALCFLSRGA